MEKRNTKIISISLPGEVVELLRDLCLAQNRTASNLVSTLLQNEWKRLEKKVEETIKK